MEGLVKVQMVSCFSQWPSAGSALLQCQKVLPCYNVSRFSLLTMSAGSALLQHQKVLPCYSINRFCLVTVSTGSALLQRQQVLPCYSVSRFLLVTLSTDSCLTITFKANVCPTVWCQCMFLLAEGKVHELPLFGNYCCRLAAVPDCLVKPVVSGFLNIQVSGGLLDI